MKSRKELICKSSIPTKEARQINAGQIKAGQIKAGQVKVRQLKVGIGLRLPHIDTILKNHKILSKKIGWLEIHSENYYAEGGSSTYVLKQLAEHFPISFHSVGNSLGSAQGLDLSHLKKLKNLIHLINPIFISDHISWGLIDKKHSNDLLPLPYTKESLNIISQNISHMQDFLGREILVENPSTYLAFKNPEMSESEFVNELASKTGCGLLLDINNVYVSSNNNSEFDAKIYLEEIDPKIVKEVHLAGHSVSNILNEKGKRILIDTHDNLVCDEVWDLYENALKKFGNIPTIMEWDQDIPELEVLLNEAKKAERLMRNNARS